MNRRGISAIVATVLVILITVAGVSIIWVAVVPMISEGLEFDALEGRVSVVSSGGYTLYDVEREVAMVQVRREVDEGVMNRVRISFIIDGNSVSSNVVAPESGQVKTYNFDLSGYGEPESVGVAPIFVSGSGSEKEGSVSSEVGLWSGVIGEIKGVVYKIGVDYFYDELPMTGLISWWKFDGDVNDSIGVNHGGLNYDANVDGDVLNLDGYRDRVYIADSNDDYYFSYDSFSVSVWVELNLIGVNHPIIEFQPAGNGHHLLEHNSVYGWIFRHRPPGGSSVMTVSEGGVTSEVGVWYNIVFTREGSEWRIYRDGVEIAQGLSSLEMLNGAYISLGMEPDSDLAYRSLNGSLDDVMIYSRALTEDEVVAIYDIQKGGTI